jgi:cysteine desulfuration protein SufE
MIDLTGTVEEREARIEALLNGHSDWMDRYEEIIKLGNSLEKYPEGFRQDAFKVKGCQSQVWLHPEVRDGLVHFDADSDAAITRGLIAMMVAVLSDRPATEIAKASLGFLDRLGLKEHLSPTRSNGLSAMVKQMKLYALVLAQRG